MNDRLPIVHRFVLAHPFRTFVPRRRRGIPGICYHAPVSDTPANRRAQLTAQLGQVFRERGYEGATLTQLAAATGLGKASLYHHFPGGKAEMLDVLVREAIALAETRAFARLEGPGPAQERLAAFIDGFADYLQESGGPCLLGVLALGSSRQAIGDLAGQMSEQMTLWRQRLERSFEAAGCRPKRAARSAAEVLETLYGAQVLAELHDDPRHLRRACKRLQRELRRLQDG